MQQANIKVSIIVPVYNAEDYIYDCLSSLQNQTLKDIEIICIDDCSTDASVDIINNKFVSKDSRFSLYKNEDKKFACGSRNFGIKVAKGEYIGFVDSDDYVDLDYYEKLYDNAKIYNADIAVGGIDIIDVAANNSIKKCDYDSVCEYLPEKILKKIKEGVSCDKIYRSSFLKKNKKVRFPENIVYAEDILFSYFALTRCHKVVFTKGSFYYWLRRLSSISFVSSEEKRADNALKVLYAIFNDLVKNKATQDLAGISLNWALPYLEMFAFKDFNNIEIFNQKLQEYYPRLRIK